MSIKHRTMDSQHASFTLLLGPMFASKTTELIRIANRYMSIGTPILAINHSLNTRYGTDQICTHDLHILNPCVSLPKLMELFEQETMFEEYKKADLIFIEEIQFFPDAVDFVHRAFDIDGKSIVAAGLSGDSRRLPFGPIPQLIPLATEITHLTALCKLCKNGNPAPYTLRYSSTEDQDKQTSVGAAEQYMPVCHYHYFEQQPKI
jgi:thymidine kinase